MIPFEGIPVDQMDTRARQLVLAIAEQFVALLPAGPRTARLRGDRRAPGPDMVLLDRAGTALETSSTTASNPRS